MQVVNRASGNHLSQSNDRSLEIVLPQFGEPGAIISINFAGQSGTDEEDLPPCTATIDRFLPKYLRPRGPDGNDGLGENQDSRRALRSRGLNELGDL
jgi:hypothetical protein